MIENELLHLILDTISKQIEQPWQVLQDDSRFMGPITQKKQKEIKKWGSLQKDKVDNTNERVA
jgi:hypothetical protein